MNMYIQSLEQYRFVTEEKRINYLVIIVTSLMISDPTFVISRLHIESLIMDLRYYELFIDFFFISFSSSKSCFLTQINLFKKKKTKKTVLRF